MERIDYKKESIPFTQVANSLVCDPNLTAKAKGLYTYLYSKPDGWDFAVDRIATEMADGRKSINSGLQELEKAGYLTRSRQSTGRVTYFLRLKSQMPKTDMGAQKPNVQNGTLPKRHFAEMGMISNKEGEVIKSISNKELAGSVKPTPAGEKSVKYNPLGSEIIKAFEEVDPKNKTYYGNTTQRGACDFLLEEYGLESVLSVIKILPKTNPQSFMPTITTPVQLRDKWVQLRTAIERRQSENKSKYVIV